MQFRLKVQSMDLRKAKHDTRAESNLLLEGARLHLPKTTQHVSARLEIASSWLAYLAVAAFNSIRIRSIPLSVTFSGKWVPAGVDLRVACLNAESVFFPQHR